MTKNDVLRKVLNFGADALCIMAASLICAFLYHPNASFAVTLPLTPMLIILMGIVGVALKTYRTPISADVASSMALAIGTLVLSLAVSALFLLLIDSRKLKMTVLPNLLVWSAFFLGLYRMMFLTRQRATKRIRRKEPIVPEIGPGPMEEPIGRDSRQSEAIDAGNYVADKTVLVTGGAGAVGFELVCRLLQQNARRVVVFDLNENKLCETETELSLKYPKARFVTCIGSIQDRARLREIFDLYAPQIVYHAASYRHAEMMAHNPQEALKNNVMGTLYLVEMAIKHRAERFILLSDDMAAKPQSIMGASKRVAEMLVQRANEWGETIFSAVRFGAAAGNSAVVQLFRKQIASGGPVYISDSNAKRYIITIPEASRLIMEAGGLSKGGEIFELKGEPVYLHKLALEMIERSGLRPGRDIKIVWTGARAPDKKAPEAMPIEKASLKTPNERINVLKEGENPPVIFEEVFDTLCQSIDNRDYSSAFNKISVLIPTFRNA